MDQSSQGVEQSQPAVSVIPPAFFADTLPQIVWMADESGNVTYFNRQWYEYTGLSEAESLGLGFRVALHPQDERRTLARWERAWSRGEAYEIEYRLYSRQQAAYRWFLARANVVRDAAGAIVQWSGTCTDVDAQKRFEEEVRRHAAELKESRAKLDHLARHDALTGLPNRLMFEDRLERALVTAARSGRLVSVFFLDLDGFKRVNDTLGHHAGDELLKQVARRLQETVRASDTVARLGGDEFVVLAADLDLAEDAMVLARKLLLRAGAPYDLGAQRVRLSASLGASLYPDDADSPSSLLRHADVAMYRAKRGGKNDVRFYAPGMNVAAHERMMIAAHLDGALERGELRLDFQPQWEPGAERPHSFEALLRWDSPALGVVPPDRFVSIAEDNGVIIDICSWVLDESCRRIVEWSRAAGETRRVSMNLSLVQIDRNDFVDTVASCLARHGVEAGQLELELTARLGVEDIVAARAQMEALRALGVRLVMDQFGTPGSSIDHVLRLPLHALKIDQDVVGGSLEDDGFAEERSGRVFEALVGLAQALDLEVVASGVETEAQRRRALALGCSRLQGYLLGPPMSADAVAAMVRGVDEVAVDGA